MFPLLLATLALVSEASAAEIQVISSEPITLEVDGRVVGNRAGERGATAVELAGGNHRVQLFDPQDRLVTSATVSVTVNEQVRFELRRGQLTELGRGPLPTATAAMVCPEPAPPPAPEPGTVQLTGIPAENVAMWVDGRPARYGAGSFVAAGLAPGLHDVRIARGNATLYSGAMKVYPGLVRRCMPEAGDLDCVFVESVVSQPPRTPPAPPVAVIPPPPPAPPVMSDREFTALVAAVKGEAFSSDQLGIVRSAARSSYFTIAQVGVVLDQLAHSSDKIEAATILAPRVIDRQNAWKLNEHLTFSSDKEAVRKLFQ
ncbi:MAG: DUF4476 domain-containing protein [Pseudomonadota bacterium]|nr:DUF4476 domain-containing protein [Pseudomonadota bacterium]